MKISFTDLKALLETMRQGRPPVIFVDTNELDLIRVIVEHGWTKEEYNAAGMQWLIENIEF